MLAVRLPNTSFTSSHDHVVFQPGRASKLPHMGGSAQGRPPFIISRLHQVTVNTCTMGGHSPEPPKNPCQVIAQTWHHTLVHTSLQPTVTLPTHFTRNQEKQLTSCGLAQGKAHLQLHLSSFAAPTPCSTHLSLLSNEQMIVEIPPTHLQYIRHHKYSNLQVSLLSKCSKPLSASYVCWSASICFTPCSHMYNSSSPSSYA